MAYADLRQLPIVHRSKDIVFVDVLPDPEEHARRELVSYIDPRTKLAVDLLTVFRSKETSPEVRQFIENTFLLEQNQLVPPDNLTPSDDDIIAATPNRYDTLNEYEERLAKSLEDEKAQRKVKRSKSKLRAAFEKVGLSTDYFDKI